MANFIYGYFSIKRRVVKKFLKDRFISEYALEWGTWTDEQVPNTYSHYADLVMETLLEKLNLNLFQLILMLEFIKEEIS